jgi:hypothetical protein
LAFPLPGSWRLPLVFCPEISPTKSTPSELATASSASRFVCIRGAEIASAIYAQFPNANGDTPAAAAKSSAAAICTAGPQKLIAMHVQDGILATARIGDVTAGQSIVNPLAIRDEAIFLVAR